MNAEIENASKLCMLRLMNEKIEEVKVIFGIDAERLQMLNCKSYAEKINADEYRTVSQSVVNPCKQDVCVALG